MKIQRQKIYRIKGNSQYFLKKYGTSNPRIQIEGTDIDFWGKSWTKMEGNPAAILFGMRAGMENLPVFEGQVWGGKIEESAPIRLSELVHESELEEC